MFNPLTYEIIKALSWRWSYVIYGCAVLVLGLGAGMTFKPIHRDTKETKYTSCHNEEQDIILTGTDNTSNYSSISKDKVDKEMAKDTSEPHDTVHVEELTITKKTKIIFGAIWLVATLTKCIAYYIPDLVLVSHLRLCLIV